MTALPAPTRGAHNNNKLRDGLLPLLLPLGLLLAFFGLWEGAVRLWRVPEYLLPAPSAVLEALGASWEDLGVGTAVTFASALLGFGLAALAGLGLGVAIFHSPALRRGLYPLLIASRNVPLFAIAPLLVVWLGFGLPPKVALAAFIAFFPVVVATVDGLAAVDPDYVALMRVLGAGRWRTFRTVRLPGALPAIFSGLKLGLVYAVLGAVFAEMVVGGQVWSPQGPAAGGLGHWIRVATNFGRLDEAFAVVFGLSGGSLLLFGSLVYLERRALRWQRIGSQRERAGNLDLKLKLKLRRRKGG